MSATTAPPLDENTRVNTAVTSPNPKGTAANKTQASDAAIASKVAAYFDECQRSVGVHKKSIVLLRKLHQSSPENVEAAFLHCLKLVLPHFKREACVTRLLKFFGTVFAAEEGGSSHESGLGDAFAVRCLKALLNTCTAVDKGVRLRSIQVVGMILNGLSGDCELLDDSLWERVESTLLPRLNDKVPSIRCAALAALERMQDPEQSNCVIIQGFLRLLAADSSADVRKTVLQSIALTKETIASVLERASDVKESVRMEAYSQVLQRLHVQSLSISQRVSLLKIGLNERSEKVRLACYRVLCEGWLPAKKFHPLALLEGLQVEANEQICEKAIRAIFAYEPNDSEMQEAIRNATSTSWAFAGQQDIPSLRLTPEGALFWRVQCEELRAQGKADSVEDMIPDVSSFCDLLEEAATSYLEKESVAEDQGADDEDSEELEVFILKQLLQMLSSFDSGHDTIGQRRVQQLMINFLKHERLSEDLVAQCVKVLKTVSVCESDFSRHLVSLVTEVTRSSELEELVEEKQQLEVSGVGQEDAISSLNEEIAAVQQELSPPSGEESPWRFYRGLTITAALLRNLGRGEAIVELEVLLQNIVLPGLQHELALVRLVACECLGLLSLLSRSHAEQRMPLLETLLKTEIEDANVRAAALKGMFDMVMVHGVLAKEEAEEVLLTLLTTLEDEEEKLRLISAEGLAKVSFSGRLLDIRVIQCLIVLLFHPSSEKDHRVRQCLSVFFPFFGSQSANNQSLLVEVFENVMSSILRPPHDSPLEEIPVMQIAQYFVFVLAQASNELKLNLIKYLLCQIVADPTNSNIRAVVKCLGTVDCKLDETIKKIVHEFVDDSGKKIEDAIARKNLAKWVDTVPAVDEGSTIDTSEFKVLVKERQAEVEESLKDIEHESHGSSSEEDVYSGSDSDE